MIPGPEKIFDDQWRANSLCSKINFLDPDFIEEDITTEAQYYTENTRAAHDIFFPQRGHDNTGTRAKNICEQCPVQVECLAYALKAKQKLGYWGGSSGETRRKIRSMKFRMTDDDIKDESNKIDDLTADLEAFFARDDIIDSTGIDAILSEAPNENVKTFYVEPSADLDNLLNSAANFADMDLDDLTHPGDY